MRRDRETYEDSLAVVERFNVRLSAKKAVGLFDSMPGRAGVSIVTGEALEIGPSSESKLSLNKSGSRSGQSFSFNANRYCHNVTASCLSQSPTSRVSFSFC